MDKLGERLLERPANLGVCGCWPAMARSPGPLPAMSVHEGVDSRGARAAERMSRRNWWRN